MSDLLRTFAFAYRRKGERAMPANALRLMLAFDLNWFAPADAKRAVERAIGGGLLVPEDNGEVLRLAYDADAVEVPVGFRPTPAVLEEPFPELPPAPPAAPATPAAAPTAVPPAAPAPAAAPASIVAQAPAPSAAEGAALAAAVPTEPTEAPVDDLERAAHAERERWNGMMTLDVARLVVRRRRGEDVAPLLADAEQALLKRAPTPSGSN